MLDLPRPDKDRIVNVLTRELQQLNDNRLYLLALVDEMAAQATSQNEEIVALRAEIDLLRGEMTVKEARGA